MNRSLPMQRRRFMKLMAAGLAALAVPSARARAVAAATARRTPPKGDPEHPTPAAVAREVAKQKKSLADTVKTLRAYELPAGFPPASVFRAMKRKER